MGTVGVEKWTTEPFLADARAWVADVLVPHGRTLTGEWAQPHARPWSSAIRFETDHGRVWFKVNGGGTRHEPALLAVLARLVPDLVPQVLDVDDGRGWSLTADAGPMLRDLWSPQQLWERWPEVLQQYAAAQLALAGHADEVRASGLPDLTPRSVPTCAAALLEQLAGEAPDEGGLDGGEVAALTAALPALAGWCETLAESGVPTSVNHDDVHSGNVCVRGADTRLIDWGDAVWAHPFTTLLGTLNSIAWHAGVPLSDRRVTRVRDAYLEVFAAAGTPEERLAWLGAARRSGCVIKACSYVRAFHGAPREAQREQDWPVRGWLLELLDPAMAG